MREDMKRYRFPGLLTPDLLTLFGSVVNIVWMNKGTLSCTRDSSESYSSFSSAVIDHVWWKQTNNSAQAERKNICTSRSLMSMLLLRQKQVLNKVNFPLISLKNDLLLSECWELLYLTCEKWVQCLLNLSVGRKNCS